MYAVIFEVYPKDAGRAEYIQRAAGLRDFLAQQKGCISAERFQSLVDDKKLLSLSYWQSEEDIAKWRNFLEHRQSQKSGKDQLFSSYAIRVAEVVREYTNENRIQAPEDSNKELC